MVTLATACAGPTAQKVAVNSSAQVSRGSAVAADTTGCRKAQTLTFTSAQDAAALHYWTRARMKAATGFSQAALGGLSKMRKRWWTAGTRPAMATQCAPAGSLSEAVAAITPGQASLAATAFNGYPTIGKLTYNVDGILSLSCTASVIQGTSAPNNEQLILTAAHCIKGTIGSIAYTSTNLAFAPMWHDNQAPYGTWTAEKVFLDRGWMTCTIPIVDCTTNPLEDYAIIVLKPKNGKGVGYVTGANGWSINQPATLDKVTIAGIPGNSRATLVTTTKTVTVTESGEPYRQATTPGFTDGSSGGPWLTNFNATTGRGVLIGDTGGFEQGGPSSGSPSFSDHWTSDFAALVKAAVNYEG
jgi:V8-like Glu-specific endopeptidase